MPHKHVRSRASVAAGSPAPRANEPVPQRPVTAAAAGKPRLRPHLVSSGERRPLVQSRERLAPLASPHAAAKRAIDVLGAVVLAVVFSPLILAIVIVALIRREQGSVIYKHRRIGQAGRAFECLKFRSMVPNADQMLRELLERDPALKVEWVRDHKLRCDPRVTRLGRFLRRTSLDELPQLWNVMRGDMSLVGPRPVTREELLQYGRNVRAYLSTKPGITGLWQVKGRNDTNYHRRVVLDTYYVRNQNLLLDLYILFRTMRVILGGSGAY